MLSALFFDMVEGIKQYFLNLITPEDLNYRIAYPLVEKNSPDLSFVQSLPQSQIRSGDIRGSLGLKQSEMKLRHRFNRWTFVSRDNVGSGDAIAERIFDARHSAEGLSRSSSCLAHATEVESIELSCRSTRERDLVREVYGHHFSPIPLDVDTFCDFCNKPIYGLGYGPVCQRCAGNLLSCYPFR
ncbi:hypothetical protein FGIG_02685 [Fasciola gigantica]|uniref:Phorbol-ester/DAG-type domain-containing protein n=1 Tax=Fasciola gigantica TaxID=46835 RepID=A0A504YLE2_FASGI|nr:hypothetical protein FGIG_02685 [Fasciola gigantica]